MSEFKIGRRVQAKQRNGMLSAPFVDKTGVVCREQLGNYVWVRLDVPVSNQREWSFPIEYLELIALSPEEQAQLDDQERRRQHADRYL